MPEGDREWLSLHLDFLTTAATGQQIYGAPCDRLITEIVGPLSDRFRAEERVSRTFFIRYRDRKPHVRFRLLSDPTEHPRLHNEVERSCTRFMAGRPSVVTSVRVRVIPYEPEFARYGEARGVKISEKIFETSSDLVLALLPVLHRAEGNLELRLGLGVMGVVLLTGALLAGEPVGQVVQFLARYGNGNPDQAGDPLVQNGLRGRLHSLAERQDRLCDSMAGLFEAATSPGFLPTPLSTAAQGLNEMREELVRAWHQEPLRIHGHKTRSPVEAIHGLIHSYLHMHLNRLGVPPAQEILVGTVACKALRREVRCA